MNRHDLLAALLAAAVTLGQAGPALGDAGHDHGEADRQSVLEQARDLHSGHQHGHDFDAMTEMSAQDMERMIALMTDVGLALPPMDSGRGRQLFVDTGCVVCHAVNGVGGAIGPSLNAADMPVPMNAFEFAARMWRSAPAMVAMQQDLLGQLINLTGQDLADLVAFAHDDAEQAKLTADQIPARYHDLLQP